MSEVKILCELINGELSRAQRYHMIATHNPATGDPLGMAPCADRDTVTMAIGAARHAFDDGLWHTLPTAIRANLLRDIADLMESNVDALAQAETADTGMLLKMTTQGHVPRAIAHFRYFANELERMSGECFPIDDAYLQIVQREALGVVAILAPWNAPLAVATINLAAALAAGNTVVLKSSERAPLSLSLLAELIASIDIPPGVINILHGDGETSGQWIAQSDVIDGLCFVGGTETARSILAQGQNAFRRNTFELGGKSATIVCADACLEEAIDGALLSVYSSNGEVCTAGSRIFIQAPLYEVFAERFIARAQEITVGDPCDPRTELGPLIDEHHLIAVQQHIQRAVEQGGVLACGGTRVASLPNGAYLRPAVITNVNSEMSLFHEEVFGPVAALMPFENHDDAIALANDSAYGLAATLWSSDVSNALTLTRKLKCGVISINSPVIRDIRVPFGGVRASGLGRIGGRWSIEQYSELKTTCIPLNSYTLPRYGSEISNE